MKKKNLIHAAICFQNYENECVIIDQSSHGYHLEINLFQ